MTITPEMAEVIEAAINDRLIDVHTSLPGVIQDYDSATQTATVELQVKRALDGEEDELVFEDLPVLQNVKVVFPRTRKYAFSFPIEAGDTGDVIFSEAPIGQWRSVEDVAFPDDVGRHTLSGAKFYPGLPKDSDILPSDTQDGIQMIYDDVAYVRIGDDETITLENQAARGTLKADGQVKFLNENGYFELKPNGQFDANGNFTVDP